MGRASQAKKAARLARESGQVEARPKRRLLFPMAVAGAVLVGAIVVFFARQPAEAPKLDIDPTAITVDSSTTTVAGAGTADPTSTPSTVAPTTVAPQ